MRNWLIIGMVAALLVAGAAWLWPGSASRTPAAPTGKPAATSLPAFSAVEVSSGTNEGLTLTGRVLDSAGRPVANAEVFLASSAEKTLADVRCDECGQALLSCQARETALQTLAYFEHQHGFLTPRATASTDAQGNFRFEHLAGVSFSIWAKAPGLGVALRERAAPGDPVELYLPPLRTIGGQVVDDAGQPLKGARVHAVSRRVPLPFEAVAGPDGVFSLEGLGEGPFYVVATAEGYLPSVEAQVEAGPQPVRLKLTPARTLEVRVTRNGAPAAATVRLRADHLSREQRTEGEPLRFTGLYPDELVVTAEAPGLGAAPRTLTLDARVTQVTLELEVAGKLLVTVVDEAGEPVPNPELLLRTTAGDLITRVRGATGAMVELGPLAAGDYVLHGQAEGFREAQLPARIVAGETTLELEMERATLITGQVLDEYGRPAPRVSVLVQPTGETVLADEDGRFAAPVPTPGLYELHAHHSEWGGGQVKVTAPASGVQLSLEPRAALEVTVSSAGRRVEGADVVLWVEQEGIFRSDRTSGSDGVVPMRGMPAGTYWMVASHPDYLPSDRKQVTLEDGQTLKLEAELKPGAPLSGEVVDGQGAPVAGATLVVVPRGAEPVQSDARGHFEFRSLRPDRGYRLEAKHPGYDQVERAEGKAGGPPVRVVLKRRDVFRGRVVGSDGAPVRRYRMDEHEVDSSDGRFELPLATAGDRIIAAVDAPGYEPMMVDRPASPDLGDLVLEKLPTVSGLVRDEGGAPVPDSVVTCDVCDESVLTGPDGRFTLANPPYVPRFTVSARKGRLSGTQSLERGSRGPVELVLRQATRLSGKVYKADGSPAAGVSVEAVNGDRSETLTLVTGPDGGYSIEVAPGSYRFMLGPNGEFSGEAGLVVQVGGTDMRLDLGPAPGTSSLTVQLKPERGKALWVVAGEVGAVGNPPATSLMRSRWAQLIYQPRGEQVILHGLPPGRYTLVWGHFHVETPGGPEVRMVDVPSQAEVALGR
ncbi:carboxypeptidase regulatory-like domain-containing protein [Pyxidicoccus fallax]|uniref:Carboxypeptidase regulatory-like domain-containing protein n=1 Tax=Pyxidicoccus fallax TaxID=394095 RepID=A0A848L7Z8_9BACT|nr:carboxypeptidase-like regulatory domain-containing protein [Pyxidicoccus fallax]NMO14382.1 carboxypeptidase regulatory-like domain-containing protein [Pyxidicoccus fallax]NPC78772.1 carboxypeptidase regulatory-like domain-containing protein [Pyxidicoccus fallax]